MVRSRAGGEPEAILALTTLGAPERRRLRRRRGRRLQRADAEPVPTARATVIRPTPFPAPDEAEAWLDSLRGRGDAHEGELHQALRRLNAALHAHRVASADPYVPHVSAEHALVARIGYGPGDTVSDGRFAAAWELPRQVRRFKRSMEAPEERFAAILGGRDRSLPAEELALRARADLDAGRAREAALQARVALESLLAGLGAEAPGRSDLEALRVQVAAAANEALAGELAQGSADGVAEALERMEAALKRRRLRA